MYRWLCEWRDAPGNPVVGAGTEARQAFAQSAVGRPGRHVRAKPAGESLLAWRDHAIVELLYSSGLRLAELVSLDHHYFDAAGSLPASTSWVDLVSAEATVVGKGGKTRQVPIGAPACAAISRWLDARARYFAAKNARFS